MSVSNRKKDARRDYRRRSIILNKTQTRRRARISNISRIEFLQTIQEKRQPSKQDEKLYLTSLFAVSNELSGLVIGNTLSSLNINSFDLNDFIDHIAKFFDISKEEHAKSLNLIRSKPVRYSLKIRIKEAKNVGLKEKTLPADPYCSIYLLTEEKSDKTSQAKKNFTKSFSMKFRSRTSYLERHRFSAIEAKSNSIATPDSSSPKLIRKSNSHRVFNQLSTQDNDNTSIGSGRGNYFKTKACKQTTNPIWNENFEMDLSNLKDQVLNIACFNNGHYGSNHTLLPANPKNSVKNVFRSFKYLIENKKQSMDFLGQISIPLKSVAEPVQQWYDLLCKHENSDHNIRGNIFLSMEIKIKNEDFDFLLDPPKTKTPVSIHSAPIARNVQTVPDLVASSQIRRNDSVKFSFELQDNSNMSALFVEYFHRIIKKIYRLQLNKLTKEHAAKNEKFQWDGTINNLRMSLLLKCYTNTYSITTQTKYLIEMITLMELKLETENIIPHTSIMSKLDSYYKTEMSLLNNPTDLASSSQNHLNVLNNYEVNQFIMVSVNYIRDYLQNSGIATYPPDAETQSLLENKINFAKKIKDIVEKSYEWNGKIQFTKEISDLLAKKVQDDVSEYISGKVNIEDVGEKNDFKLLSWMEQINKTIEIISYHMEYLDKYAEIFNQFSVNYSKIVSIQISKALSGPIQFVLKCLHEYQTEYKNFPPNMRKSSNVSVYLFVYCKELVNKLARHVSGREAFKLKLNEYPSWFKSKGIYTYWLETYRLDAKEYVENALNLEDSKEHTGGVSMTSILVSSHLLRICQEWKQVNIVDDEFHCIGVATITEIIGDSCRHFVQTLEKRLDDVNYYFDSDALAASHLQIDPIKKICICINNVEHLKNNTILRVPSELDFDNMNIPSETMCEDSYLNEKLKEVLSKSVNEAIKDMDLISYRILSKAGSLLVPILKSKIHMLYSNKSSRLFKYLEDTFDLIDKKMPSYNVNMAVIIWENVVKLMYELLPQKEKFHFYADIYQHFINIQSLFDHFKLPPEFLQLNTEFYDLDYNQVNKLTEEELPQNTYFNKLNLKLRIMSEPSSSLILNHLRHLNENRFKTTNVEENTNVGQICFKASKEAEVGSPYTYKIKVKVMYCKNINMGDKTPTMISPYIRVELMPASLFNNCEFKSTGYVYNTRNPDYNQVIEFPRLPRDTISLESASIRLSCWHHDIFGNDQFIGECFYQVADLESSDSLASIDKLPVVIKALEQPLADEYKKLKELFRRSEFDEEASLFIETRNAMLTKNSRFYFRTHSSARSFCFNEAITKKLDTLITSIKCFQFGPYNAANNKSA